MHPDNVRGTSRRSVLHLISASLVAIAATAAAPGAGTAVAAPPGPSQEVQGGPDYRSIIGVL